MADTILSAVLERLKAFKEEEDLELANKIETIRNILDDAERRGVTDQSVGVWLKKLEDTAYEMDDILDELYYHAIDASATKKVSFIPSLPLCFKKVVMQRDATNKIKKVHALLDEILKEKDGFNFEITIPPTDSAPRVQTTSLIDLEKVEGQADVERNKNSILRKLMNDSDCKILSIVGVEGIGKTTLAQLVYNDSRVKDFFELTIWICVPIPFDVAGIARKIIEIVEKKSPPVTNQLAVILQMLRYSISGKKFLLVLDDVWTEEHKWEPLKINLEYGAPSSKILVTTNKIWVARMMRTSEEEIYYPNFLTDEESWSLLHRVSLPGSNKEECVEFEEVGKKIAGKCRGLPLAINLLGGVLRFKNSLKEWRNLLESELWELDNIEFEYFIPYLILSYSELSPPALKRCFSYCVIYPPDFQIDVNRLIQKWMALGYLGPVIGNAGVEVKGREYFNNLAIRSLFQDFEKTRLGKEQIWSCKMHDIVYNFAQFIKMDDRSHCLIERPFQLFYESLLSVSRNLFWDKESPPYICDCCLTSLRVLEFKRKLINGCPRGMKKLIHLRWLDISSTKLSKEDVETICKLYFLQTLLFRECSLKEIPKEIGNLIHLRYLDLSENKGLRELPHSICNLVELQTLLLSRCSLKEIPHEIGKLVELRHLDLSQNREIKELPKSMYTLIELQTLLLRECSLEEIHGEIGNLIHLRHLDLSENFELGELPESMCNLVELHILDIAYCMNLGAEGLANLSGLTSLNGFLGGSGCMCRNLYKLPEGQLSVLNSLNEFFGGSGCMCRILRRFPEGSAQLSGLGFLGRSGCNKFELLKNLNSLRELSISISSISTDDMKELVKEAGEAKLKEKEHLQKLELNFIDQMRSSFSSSLWVDIIEALEPSGCLEFLKILHYKGSRLPRWISSTLNQIREIQIWDCSEVSSLPPMGKLPFLEKLYIRRMERLEVLGAEWLGIRESEEAADVQSSSVVAFPNLKELKFEYCRKWSMWEDITEEEEEEKSASMSVMPCLVRLYLLSCNALKTLPHRLLRKSSSLQLLEIKWSPELIKCYEDNDGSPRRSISRNNPQLFLRTVHF